MNGNQVFIEDIKNSINKILEYTLEMSKEEFLNDNKTKDAVERNFEIIGEAVKNLSDDFKKKYPEIPFRQIAGMRDKIIHEYFGIDYEIIWKTIQNRLPEFKKSIEKILNN